MNGAAQQATSTTSAQEWTTWSSAFRQGLVDYDFRPMEVLTLLQLCAETFDAGRLEAAIRIEHWAARLGWRADKFKNLIWKELVSLGVIDPKYGQGTYQLRPAIASWSMARGRRVPANLRAGLELPLVDERPLSDALSDLSRQNVLTTAPREVLPAAPAPAGSQGTSPRPDWEGLRRAISRGEDYAPVTADKSAAPAVPSADLSSAVTADKSAAAQGQPPGPQSPGNYGAPRGSPSAAQNAADLSAASIASLAFKKKAKLANPEEKSVAAWRWLESIDTLGALNLRQCARQWRELCNRDPDYVLLSLRGTLERGLQLAIQWQEPIVSQLGYIAVRARADRKLRKV